MRIKHVWSLVFVSLSIAAFFFYQQYQPQVTYAFAESFDGNDYTGAYEYFSGQTSDFKVPPPFHQRILVPYLASLFQLGIINDFEVINLVFTILSIWVTFLVWRKLGLEFKWLSFGFIWLIFHWSGIIRLNAFDPITVDVPIYFFHASLLYILLYRKFNYLYLLVPLAMFQKESMLGYIIILTVYAAWHNRKAEDGYFKLQPFLISTGIAIIIKFFISDLFPPSEPGRGPLIMIAYQAKQLLLEPFELVRWIGAMSMAYGIALWLGIIQFIRTRNFDVKRNLLVMLSLISLGYALLAGGDMTRIAFLGFPFVFSFILFELQRTDFKAFYLLAILSLPFMMLQSSIPDPGFQWNAWEQWYPEFADSKLVLLTLVYTGICLAICLRTNAQALNR